MHARQTALARGPEIFPLPTQGLSSAKESLLSPWIVHCSLIANSVRKQTHGFYCSKAGYCLDSVEVQVDTIQNQMQIVIDFICLLSIYLGPV